MIALLKAVHVAALAVWCGGVLALPFALQWHRFELGQWNYARLRIITHAAYTWIVTPAAVIAISAGAALIFLRDVFTPWMFAKLVFVGLLVIAHVWVGHLVVQIGELRGHYPTPRAWPPVLATLVAIVGILSLVLLKPAAPEAVAPNWLRAPLGHTLPFPETPR